MPKVPYSVLDEIGRRTSTPSYSMTIAPATHHSHPAPKRPLSRGGGLRLALLLLTLCLLLPQPAMAEETITWMTADRPTSYILHGPDKGMGVVDQLYRLLWKEMPEYDHQTRPMSFGRALKEMAEGKNICAVGFISPEREAVGCFSIPAVVSLPYSIVARKGHLEGIFGDVEAISLCGLLARGDLKGGVVQKRSYGSLNPLIAAEEDRKMLYVLTPGADKVEMLLKGRIDYLVEIAPFMTYQAKQSGNQDLLTSFAIEESKERALTASVFCANTKFGQEVITKVNDIIREHRAEPAYLEMLERWYDPNSRPRLREQYRKTILHDPETPAE